jgi:L,D-peptidoglycan transpeptidase YkuD (ErfK/YbiS/YcfS/YnhG family)
MGEVYRASDTTAHLTRPRCSAVGRCRSDCVKREGDGRSPAGVFYLASATGYLYRLVVVVAHNALQQPGGGSCIVLHQRLGPGSVTAGCSAFAAAALDRTVGWLDPGAQPVPVQLPRTIYEELRRAWALPAPP